MINIKEFKEWFADFAIKAKADPRGYCREYDADPRYVPKNLDQWIEETEVGHQNIRSLLGGIQKTFLINTIDNINPVNIVEVSKIMNNILQLMPDYYVKYKLSHRNFQYEKLPNHRNIAVTKHILGYANRLNLSEDKKQTINKELAKLGKIYKDNKSEKTSVYMTLSTDPRAFCLLGYYGGLDCTSCFKQGDFNSDKKYALASHPNSFILVTHEKENIDFNLPSVKAKARAVGLMVEDALHITNIYPYYSLGNEYDINQSKLEVLYKEIFDRKPNVLLSEMKLTGGVNYPGKCNYSLYQNQFTEKVIKITDKYSKECHKHRDEYAIWD